MADLAAVAGDQQWSKYTGGQQPRTLSIHILFSLLDDCFHSFTSQISPFASPRVCSPGSMVLTLLTVPMFQRGFSRRTPTTSPAFALRSSVDVLSAPSPLLWMKSRTPRSASRCTNPRNEKAASQRLRIGCSGLSQAGSSHPVNTSAQRSPAGRCCRCTP